MNGPGYEPVHQSVMQRFLSGRNITYENASKIGEALGFDPAALFEVDIAESEAARLGITRKTPQSGDPSEIVTSTVKLANVTNSKMAPVLEWARLGDDLFTESSNLTAGEYRDTSDAASSKSKWFIADTDMPRLRIKRGWRVLVSPVDDDSMCQDGDTCLFRTSGGAFFLGDFRRMATGYEALPDSGPPLDTERHGITVVADFHGAMK